MLVCLQEGRLSIISFFVGGWTPVRHAVEAHHIETIELLMSYSATDPVLDPVLEVEFVIDSDDQ